MYLWERPRFPALSYDAEALLAPLERAHFRQGRFLGAMSRLTTDVRLESQLDAQTLEVTKSSAIEGELLEVASVRSSIARRLGIPEAATTAADRRTQGVVDMMLDAVATISEPLTADRLFAWHRGLFAGEPARRQPLRAGTWRDDANGPMRVLSGPIGRERVHFEAPPAVRVPGDMQQFLTWFDRPSTGDGLLRAGIAHLWFLTIHPFDDGDGRIGRAICDRALAQAEGSTRRFYSMSAQIGRERAAYYDELERAQRGDVDVTRWLRWFLGCFESAIAEAESSSEGVLRKAAYWHAHAHRATSERQRRILNRVLDGFEGALTAKKWAALAKVSVPTAQRDINDLVERGLLRREPGGSKNTRYALGIE